jgi:hypothetical protein
MIVDRSNIGRRVGFGILTVIAICCLGFGFRLVDALFAGAATIGGRTLVMSTMVQTGSLENAAIWSAWDAVGGAPWEVVFAHILLDLVFIGCYAPVLIAATRWYPRRLGALARAAVVALLVMEAVEMALLIAIGVSLRGVGPQSPFPAPLGTALGLIEFPKVWLSVPLFCLIAVASLGRLIWWIGRGRNQSGTQGASGRS